MTARVAIGVDARERLRRLSVVFAVELRLLIVSELYMREMSTKQFHEEFGGGSLSRVNKNFKVLENENWLRYLRSEGPGGTRRGGTEHFYRAAEPAFIDREAWGFMPYSVRTIVTWNMFKRATSRLRGALEMSRAGTGKTRDLTCTQFLLDEQGWRRAIEAATAHFVRIFDEQDDARRRASHSGEELIRTDVFSVVFESPSGDRGPAAPALIETRQDPLAFFPERLAPILKDEVCLKIVSELNRREMSVTQFHREFGGTSKSAIGRRFKALERSGWAGKAARETGGKRRGATEQFYRATKPMALSYDPCARPTSALSRTQGWRAFEQLCGRMSEAMMAGSFDARLDRFINWSFVNLDRQGRRNVIEDTERLFELISDEQAEAVRRMAKSGEKPVTMTVGLAVLEASRELTKAP